MKKSSYTPWNIFHSIVCLPFALFVGCLCVLQCRLSPILELLLFFTFFFFRKLLYTNLFALGKLIGGAISGYKLISFRFGPIAFTRSSAEGKKYRRMPGGLTGLCIMAPPKANDGHSPYLLYLLGGHILDLIISVFMTVLYFRFFYYDSIGVFFIGEMGLIGILYAANNLIPCMRKGQPNFGGTLISLGRDPWERDFLSFHTSVVASLYEIDHYSDFPEWIVDRLKQTDFTSMDLTRSDVRGLSYILACIYLWEGDYERYHEIHLKIIRTDGVPPFAEKESRCECLYYEILKGSGPEVIEQLYDNDLQKHIKNTRNAPVRKRLMFAYYHLYKKNEVAARQQYRELHHLINRHLPLSEIHTEFAIVEQLAAHSIYQNKPFL